MVFYFKGNIALTPTQFYQISAFDLWLLAIMQEFPLS